MSLSSDEISDESSGFTFFEYCLHFPSFLKPIMQMQEDFFDHPDQHIYFLLYFTEPIPPCSVACNIPLLISSFLNSWLSQENQSAIGKKSQYQRSFEIHLLNFFYLGSDHSLVHS
jgi:hypothetical protein